MNAWLRRIRGAVGMGLTWAFGGFVLGSGIELINNVWPNPFGSLLDIWPALALPAFFGGVAFSTVLGIAGRRRRFDELSLPTFAAWGALGGLLMSLIPAALVVTGVATVDGPLWRFTAALALPLTLGSAIAASGTLWLARMTEDRQLLDASRDVDDVGLTAEEARELFGR